MVKRQLDWLEIRSRSLNSGNPLLAASARVAFRDILDPYCAEYIEDHQRRWDVIKALTQAGIPLVVLCQEYKTAFKDRPDIARSCIDGLATLLWELAIRSN